MRCLPPPTHSNGAAGGMTPWYLLLPSLYISSTLGKHQSRPCPPLRLNIIDHSMFLETTFFSWPLTSTYLTADRFLVFASASGLCPRAASAPTCYFVSGPSHVASFSSCLLIPITSNSAKRGTITSR